MKSKLLLFVFALLTWTLLSWPPDWQHGVVGVVVSLCIALFTGDIFVTRPHVFKDPARYFWFAYFIPVFLWELLKANLDVAYRVIHSDRPINPGIVKVKTILKSETGLTFLANAITLTPGTMTVDLDKDNGYLYIHWINVTHQDVEGASRVIVSKFEVILARIFD